MSSVIEMVQVGVSSVFGVKRMEGTPPCETATFGRGEMVAPVMAAGKGRVEEEVRVDSCEGVGFQCQSTPTGASWMMHCDAPITLGFFCVLGGHTQKRHSIQKNYFTQKRHSTQNPPICYIDSTTRTEATGRTRTLTRVADVDGVAKTLNPCLAHYYTIRKPPASPTHPLLELSLAGFVVSLLRFGGSCVRPMGSFVRGRLIAHLCRREPVYKPCPRMRVFPALGYATAADDEASGSSWFQRLKGVFKGNTSAGTEPEPVAADAKATLPGDFTMENFADELKKARRFGSMTTFGRGLPRGGEMSAVKSLQRQEDILRALHKRDPVRVGAQQKADVAAECGCTVFDVENVVSKYEWAKEANRRVKKLEAEGKPLPKTLNEVEALMGGSWSAAASVNLAKSGNISRNAPCPCGSKKKYKRCCGEKLVEA